MGGITRRDLVNGALVAAGAAFLLFGCKRLDDPDEPYYPPSLTGLRGSHPESNTHAHARARFGRSD